MKKIIIIFIGTLVAVPAFANWSIPSMQPTNNEQFNIALTRLYDLYYLPECTAKEQSYEYIVPLLSKAIEDDPSLYTDYIKPLPYSSSLSDMHMKDLYEYQLAKSKAVNSGIADPEAALNDATFRYTSDESELPKDLLQFTLETKADGTENRFVRWVTNEWRMIKGEPVWALKKRVFADWKFVPLFGGASMVVVNDTENNEVLQLELKKVTVEEGKPAQWVLEDRTQKMVFKDYFTSFCD